MQSLCWYYRSWHLWQAPRCCLAYACIDAVLQHIWLPTQPAIHPHLPTFACLQLLSLTRGSQALPGCDDDTTRRICADARWVAGRVLHVVITQQMHTGTQTVHLCA